MTGFVDEGVFLVYKNEERVVTISFKWSPDGTFENQRTLSLGGQTAYSSLKVSPSVDGSWARILMETPLGPVSAVREGDVCRVAQQKDTQEVELKSGVLLWENLAPSLMSQLIRSYDGAAGGKQTFSLFVIPRQVIEASLERLDEVERTIGGRDQTFIRYHLDLSSVELTVWADAAGKVYVGDLPSQHAAYVREGYELLWQTPDPDPLLSAPVHEVLIDSDVQVPMRDGVKLATDVYRPAGTGKYPVLLVRTPHKKALAELAARYFARRGYVFAVQDCRGQFGSPGEWEPLAHAGADGYDTIEWLAVQPWSTGKVGMVGRSYEAWAQWAAVAERPPHLVTIIPSVSLPDPFYKFPYDHGVFALREAIRWVDVLESGAVSDISGAAFSKIGDKDYYKLLRDLPVIDADKVILGKENQYWRRWIAHPANDDYWGRLSFHDRLKGVDIPVLHQSGWFDEDGIGTKLNYLRMSELAKPHQKLILGPWAHTTTAHRRYQDRDFGQAAVVDLQRSFLRWLDYWLKGVDNGITTEPPVSVFVMGSNQWIHSDHYPLPGTRYEKWYLDSRGRANTASGDGWLTRRIPRHDSPPDRYAYDPGDPTPDPNVCCAPLDNTEEDKGDSAADGARGFDGYHKKLTSVRRDILVYESAQFRRPYTFVGPMSAVLYASSSARDTDWFVRVIELDKEGHPLTLAMGKLRARFRDSTQEPELLEPGKVYEYHLDLWHTGISIPRGHRLRVEIASAAFPSYSRNLNTGGHNEVDTDYVTARQTIHHSGKYPSHIVLPVIPDTDVTKD